MAGKSKINNKKESKTTVKKTKKRKKRVSSSPVSKSFSNIPILILVAFIVFIVFSVYSGDSESNEVPLVNVSETAHVSSAVSRTDLLTTVAEYDLNVLFCPDDDCNLALSNLFNDSNEISCAVYDVDLEQILALGQTKDFRLIMDNSQFTENLDYPVSGLLLKSLMERGKLKIDKSASKYMHNKFCLFDNNILWLGSANFTEKGIIHNNNNVIISNNPELYSRTLKEFDEMWSGTFGSGSETESFNNYPQVYFCPDDDCEEAYLDTLGKAKRNIWCMFFDMTLDSVGDKLIELKKSGVDIKVIFENRSIGQYSEYHRLNAEEMNLVKDKNPDTMHNKFCIVDDSYLITGSANPSLHSIKDNDESIIVIDNQDVIREYNEYFRKYWAMWS